MVFETLIFIPTKKSYFNLLRSEKISYAAFGIMIFSVIFLKFSSDYFPYEFNLFLFMGLLFLSIIGIFTAFIIHFWEYENLNGYFKGEIRIDLEHIFINQQNFKLSEISNLKLVVLNYKGERTNRRGASFYQGISNEISFTYHSESITVNFLIASKNQIDDLYHIFVSIIAKEKINYSRNLINLIPDKYRKTQEFKNFILKLIIEKRLECTEGLLIHGYSSDEEAKQLRTKYCSK